MQFEANPPTFSFWLKTDTKFGEGISQTLPAILQQWGSRNVAVIVDGGLRENSHAQTLIAQLQATRGKCLVVETTVSEPD